MSDFLSNLIARNQAAQPAIRPRLPSLFESAAAGIISEAPSSAPTTTADQTPPPTIHTSPKLFTTGKPATEKPMANPAFGVTAVKPPLDVDEPAALFQPATIPTPRTEAGIAGANRFEVRAKKNIVPIIVSPEGKNQDRTVQASLFQAATGRPALSSRQQNSSSPVEPRSSAPAIHVTIGRVEVRAIQSAALAPKSAKPAPPKLSLDDYLQKRDGGAR